MPEAANSVQALTPTFERAWDALEEGDLDSFMEISGPLTHPECTFRSGIGSVLSGGTYEGVEGIRSWFGDMIENTTERRWKNRLYEAPADDVVVFLADLAFRGAASGALVESEVGSVFEFKDGLCVRINSFMSHDEARKFAEARVA